jgi:prophage regulatory protein
MSSKTTTETSAPAFRVLRLPAVLARTGLGRDTVYRLGKAGKFPRSFKIGDRASGWSESEVDQWIRGRAAQRDSVNAPSP